MLEPSKQTGRPGKPEAVLYARVSSKEQEKEGFSIPAQLRLLREYASVQGLNMIREFVDVETAKQAGRTGFGEMLKFIRKRRSCRTVLVEKTDRLYRNLKDWVSIDELNVEIHFVKENLVLSADSRSSEKFIHGIKVLMAKNYIDNLSEETRKGQREKAEQGIWPSFAPLGYRNIVRSDGKKAIQPDPEVAPIISRLFEWYATGNYSLRDLTQMARNAGLAFRKSKQLVPKSTVHQVLRKRIYTGHFDWDGKTYAGVHTSLVSRQLWEQVQAVLDRRFARRHRKAKHDFAFSRLISCGHCGCSLVGEIKKQRYTYYHCTGYRGRCPEPYVREEVLEQKFTALLKNLVIDGDVLDWVSEALRESHQDQKRIHDEAIERLERKVRQLEYRIEEMYVDKLDGRIDAAFYDRKVVEWRSERDSLSQGIEEHRAANHNYPDEGIQLIQLARRAHELFERRQASEKRRLLNFVVSNCSWKDGKLTAVHRQPFDIISLAAQRQRASKTRDGVKSAGNENWLLR